MLDHYPILHCCIVCIVSIHLSVRPFVYAMTSFNLTKYENVLDFFLSTFIFCFVPCISSFTSPSEFRTFSFIPKLIWRLDSILFFISKLSHFNEELHHPIYVPVYLWLHIHSIVPIPSRLCQLSQYPNSEHNTFCVLFAFFLSRADVFFFVYE